MNQVVVDLWPQDMLLRLGRTSINTLVVNGTLNIIHIAVKVPINHHRCAQELNCCTERRRWIAIDKESSCRSFPSESSEVCFTLQTSNL